MLGIEDIAQRTWDNLISRPGWHVRLALPDATGDGDDFRHP
jgi:hypothetical protein